MRDAHTSLAQMLMGGTIPRGSQAGAGSQLPSERNPLRVPLLTVTHPSREEALDQGYRLAAVLSGARPDYLM